MCEWDDVGVRLGVSLGRWECGEWGSQGVALEITIIVNKCPGLDTIPRSESERSE